MSLAIRFRAEELRVLAFGSISGTFMGIGTAFANPVWLFLVQNYTDVTLEYSFDGVTPHFRLPQNGFLLLDVVANKSKGEGLWISQGDRLYVREVTTTPTSGDTVVSIFYGSES